jgi:hypothetical protein
MILADSSSEAAGGMGVLVLIAMWLAILVYGVICLLVPFWIYRIMENSTQSYETLRRIEQLLKPAPVEASKPAVDSKPAVEIRPKEEPGWFKL